jgi:hypothetical protein
MYDAVQSEISDPYCNGFISFFLYSLDQPDNSHKTVAGKCKWFIKY